MKKAKKVDSAAMKGLRIGVQQATRAADFVANKLKPTQQVKGTQEVVGQYSTGETYGALYPKGSPNAATFDKIIQSLIDDGTLKALAAKCLAKAWGTDPTTVPYFQLGS